MIDHALGLSASGCDRHTEFVTVMCEYVEDSILQLASYITCAEYIVLRVNLVDIIAIRVLSGRDQNRPAECDVR